MDYEKYVSENRNKDKKIYPWCYGITEGSLSIYGVTKTKEEAIAKVKEHFEYDRH